MEGCLGVIQFRLQRGQLGAFLRRAGEQVVALFLQTPGPLLQSIHRGTQQDAVLFPILFQADGF